MALTVSSLFHHAPSRSRDGPGDHRAPHTALELPRLLFAPRRAERLRRARPRALPQVQQPHMPGKRNEKHTL